jgi:hypothetical protein
MFIAKKRFNESTTEPDRVALSEDLEVFEEQRHDPCDHLLLLV